jgi:hypothetical protein
LIALGVPPEQIAFIQHYKKLSAKLALFQSINEGRVRFLLGSTASMGTGVNAQLRLKALHHLDVPWLPSDIEQREGRIERQGNQHEEIEIYAYATKGSVDATNWQMLERKSRFIALAMSGDKSIRRMEDVGSDTNQFALAKALASGDDRLIRKAGLEAEIARLQRMEAAHHDDLYNVRRSIAREQQALSSGETMAARIEQEIAQRIPTRGDDFRFIDGERVIMERKNAGELLLTRASKAARQHLRGSETVGWLGGFDIALTGSEDRFTRGGTSISMDLVTPGRSLEIQLTGNSTPLGLISRIEHLLGGFDDELARYQRQVEIARQRIPAFEARLGQTFGDAGLLDEKLDELAALEADLAATGKGEDEALSMAA